MYRAEHLRWIDAVNYALETKGSVPTDLLISYLFNNLYLLRVKEGILQNLMAEALGSDVTKKMIDKSWEMLNNIDIYHSVWNKIQMNAKRYSRIN